MYITYSIIKKEDFFFFFFFLSSTVLPHEDLVCAKSFKLCCYVTIIIMVYTKVSRKRLRKKYVSSAGWTRDKKKTRASWFSSQIIIMCLMSHDRKSFYILSEYDFRLDNLYNSWVYYTAYSALTVRCLIFSSFKIEFFHLYNIILNFSQCLTIKKTIWFSPNPFLSLKNSEESTFDRVQESMETACHAIQILCSYRVCTWRNKYESRQEIL